MKPILRDYWAYVCQCFKIPTSLGRILTVVTYILAAILFCTLWFVAVVADFQLHWGLAFKMLVLFPLPLYVAHAAFAWHWIKEDNNV